MPSEKEFKGRSGNIIDVSVRGDARPAEDADDTGSEVAVAVSVSAAADVPLISVLSILHFDKSPTILFFFFVFVALVTLDFDIPFVTSESAEYGVTFFPADSIESP